MILTFIFIELTRSESGDGTGECEWFSCSVIWYSSTPDLKFTVCVLTAWQRQTDGHIMTTGKADDDCKLVSWCLQPSQPQKDYIRAEHKLYSISKLSISQVMILRVMFFVVVVLSYLYFVGTQPGNLHQVEWPILFCRPTQEKKWEEIWEKKQIQVNGLEGWKQARN